MTQNGHLNKTSLFSAYSEGKAGRSAAVDLKEKVKQIVVIKDMSQLHSKMQLTLLLRPAYESGDIYCKCIERGRQYFPACYLYYT